MMKKRLLMFFLIPLLVIGFLLMVGGIMVTNPVLSVKSHEGEIPVDGKRLYAHVEALTSIEPARSWENLSSLNKAAASMGMSYRAAWGRIKKTEALVGQPLVTKTGPKKEYQLTDFGRDIAKKFRRWQAEVESHALELARELFPWSIRPYD